MSVEHLLLPLGEKVLRLAVVQAVPLSRHRLYDPVFLESLPVGRPLVLPALVGMQDPVIAEIDDRGKIGLAPQALEFRDIGPGLAQA